MKRIINSLLFQNTLFIVFGFAIYSNSFSSPFILDDQLFYNNPHIKNLWPPWDLFKHPEAYSQFSFRPILMLTFAINYFLSELNTWSYHVTNTCIHIASGITLFHIVQLSSRILEKNGIINKKRTNIALAVSLIWMVHPLHTESVTYTAQRAQSLMGLFFLLTFYCSLRALGPKSKLWSTFASISCLLGAGCKEIIFIAPFLILLFDRLFIFSSFKEVSQNRKFLYLGFSLTGVYIILVGLILMPNQHAGAAPPWIYFLTQTEIISHYLRLSYWPTGQCFDYVWPLVKSIEDVIVPLSFLSILFLLSILCYKRKPIIFYLSACFFLILAPTSSFLSHPDPACERWMYLPLIPVVTLTIHFIEKIISLLFHHNFTHQKKIFFLVSSSIILPLSIATFERNKVYQSAVSIWSDTAKKSPHNVRALCDLGRALIFEENDIEGAIKHIRKAVEIHPGAGTYLTLANAWSVAGEYHKAIENYKIALSLEPNHPTTMHNLAHSYKNIGKIDLAKKYFKRLLNLNPNNRFGVRSQIELNKLDAP